MGKFKNCIEEEKNFLVVQQDIKIVKALTGNNQQLRERVLKNLQKWFQQRSLKIAFEEEDFIRFWKGLFYTMWMADKPLVQEDCAEKIAKLVHFSNPETSLLFFKCGLKVLSEEWFGIDQLRLDKFLMLVRRILRQALKVLKNSVWKLELIKEFGEALLETVLKKNNSTHLGLTMHITEIYLEELAKVSEGLLLDKDLLVEFVRPFAKQLSLLEDARQITHIRKYLFHHLLHQSDEGIEYNIRFEAWRQRGFPGGTIESMQKIEASDDDDDEDISDVDEKELEEKPLDPRAGHVNVDLPQLEFDGHEISQLLLEYKFADGSTSFARKIISKLAQDFERISKGEFPLGIKEIRMPVYDGHTTTLKKSVNRLVKLEKMLMADSSKNHKRKLKLKKAGISKKIKTNDDDDDDSDSVLTGMTGIFQDQLANFIAKNEGNLLTNGTNPKKKKLISKKPRKQTIIKKQPKEDEDFKYECKFLRNSGMWVVHRYSDDDDPNNSVLSENMDSLGKDDDDKLSTTVNGNVVVDDHTPKTNNKIQKHNNDLIFPQNEWDLPPKDGEVEIFVPSNKFKKKMEKIAEKAGKNVNDLLNISFNNIKTRYSFNHNDSFKLNNVPKKRFSMDSKLVKNPFAKYGVTPKSEKRVKIDLKLNKSQDIYEHQAQLKSSPAIPYDANKRPSKPLLKWNPVGSPRNPFYRKKSK